MNDFVDKGLMASLGKDVTIVQAFSEANSVEYKLNVVGTTPVSSKQPGVFLNDKKLNITFRPGLNVIRLENNQIKEHKVYNIVQDWNQLKTYLESISTGNIILLTVGDVRSVQPADEWFSTICSAWPGTFMFENYKCAYSAVYSCKGKKIAIEHKYTDDGTERGCSHIETIFDRDTDIGRVGFPNKIYESFSVINKADQVILNAPESTPADMSKYGILPGQTIFVSGICSINGTDHINNVHGQISVRFFNDFTLVKVIDIPFKSITPRVVSGVIEVPANANKFIVVVGKDKNNTNGTTRIQHLLITHATPELNSLKAAMFGVNGVKTNGSYENSLKGNIVDQNSAIDRSGTIYPHISPIDYAQIKTIDFSVNVSCQNAAKIEGRTLQRIGGEVQILYTDNTIQYLGVWLPDSDYPSVVNKTISGKLNIPQTKQVASIGIILQVNNVTFDSVLVNNPVCEINKEFTRTEILNLTDPKTDKNNININEIIEKDYWNYG